MKKLLRKNFQLARRFMGERGRPIDRAWFGYIFEDGPVEGVWEALAGFANDDGGFGHAMEPDCRLPGSSVLATITAFPYLHQTGAPADHPLVVNGVRYLLETYDPRLQGWRMLPPEANEYPRAFWWNQDPSAADTAASANWINPSAAVVGILHRYRELVPSDLLKEVTEKALVQVKANAETMDGHSFLTCIELSDALEEPLKGSVLSVLKKQARRAVETDPAKWTGYGIRPLWAVPDPDSPLLEELGDAVHAHLDFEIDQQADDGSWHPFWTWGQFEEEWEIAKVEWQGQLTVKVLRSLKAFGRIEQEAERGL